MQYKAVDPDIEVNGDTVLVVVGGMTASTWLAERILGDHGIDKPEPDKWYKLQDLLDAFSAIGEQVGPLTLNKIGRHVFGDTDWPPGISDVHAALGSIDVGYHEVHRRHGRALFDEASGVMSEGIGHYRYGPRDERSGTMTCDCPYPCEYDTGIIEATVRRFCPPGSSPRVVHEGGACRKAGDRECIYLVSW